MLNENLTRSVISTSDVNEIMNYAAVVRKAIDNDNELGITGQGLNKLLFEDAAPKFLRHIIDLIFSGRMTTAWQFLDMIVPRTSPDNEAFRENIMNTLIKSQYYGRLKKLNNLP